MAIPNDILIALVSSLATLVITLFTGYFAHRWQMSREIKIHDREVQQRTIGSLMGQKLKISQLYVSRFEAYIFSDFHEARWRLTGHPNDSHDFVEANRWMHRSEDLAIEIAHTSEKLYETLGLISSSYKRTNKLLELVTAVYQHKVPTIQIRPFDLKTIEELENWKIHAMGELQAFVEREVTEPINNLVNYLLTKS
jgi:uncharacterized protein YneF (UPF0154 family)